MILGTEDLLTRGEVATVLGVKPRAVGSLSESGKLSCIWTPGHRRRYRRDEVNRLAESRVTKPGGDA